MQFHTDGMHQWDCATNESVIWNPKEAVCFYYWNLVGFEWLTEWIDGEEYNVREMGENES